MSAIFKSLKITLIGGALVVLPAWLTMLLLLKILFKMEDVVKPISAALPDNIIHPLIIATLLLLLICFIAGTLIQTTIGLGMKNTVEKAVMEKIPGYTTIRDLANQISNLEDKRGFKPALVEIEEAPHLASSSKITRVGFARFSYPPLQHQRPAPSSSLPTPGYIPSISP